jgi:hypothetical protein
MIEYRSQINMRRNPMGKGDKCLKQNDPRSSVAVDIASSITIRNCDESTTALESSPYRDVSACDNSSYTMATPLSLNITNSDLPLLVMDSSPSSNTTNNLPPITTTLLCSNIPSCDKPSSPMCDFCKLTPYCSFTCKNQNVQELFC